MIGEPDLEKWTKWLTENLPVRFLSVDVKIESLFRGSSLMLAIMPVEIWTMLSVDGPSFNFITHVGSNNDESNNQLSLPYRPVTAPSEEENQPFSHFERKSLG